MNRWKQFAAALGLGVVCATTSASPWTQTIEINQAIPPALTYTHDLGTAGFTSGNDTVTGLTLSVTLRDDSNNDRLFGDWIEVAVIDPEGNIVPILWDNWFLSSEIDGTTVATQSWSGSDWTLGYAQDGLFQVTVSNAPLTGDFILVRSTLTATGTSVPLPGALALMGIGMVGLGVATRRKQP